MPSFSIAWKVDNLCVNSLTMWIHAEFDESVWVWVQGIALRWSFPPGLISLVGYGNTAQGVKEVEGIVGIFRQYYSVVGCCWSAGKLVFILLTSEFYCACWSLTQNLYLQFNACHNITQHCPWQLSHCDVTSSQLKENIAKIKLCEFTSCFGLDCVNSHRFFLQNF